MTFGRPAMAAIGMDISSSARLDSSESSLSADTLSSDSQVGRGRDRRSRHLSGTHEQVQEETERDLRSRSPSARPAARSALPSPIRSSSDRQPTPPGPAGGGVGASLLSPSAAQASLGTPEIGTSISPRNLMNGAAQSGPTLTLPDFELPTSSSTRILERTLPGLRRIMTPTSDEVSRITISRSVSARRRHGTTDSGNPMSFLPSSHLASPRSLGYPRLTPPSPGTRDGGDTSVSRSERSAPFVELVQTVVEERSRRIRPGDMEMSQQSASSRARTDISPAPTPPPSEPGIPDGSVIVTPAGLEIHKRRILKAMELSAAESKKEESCIAQAYIDELVLKAKDLHAALVGSYAEVKQAQKMESEQEDQLRAQAISLRDAAALAEARDFHMESVQQESYRQYQELSEERQKVGAVRQEHQALRSEAGEYRNSMTAELQTANLRRISMVERLEQHADRLTMQFESAQVSAVQYQSEYHQNASWFQTAKT